MGFELPEHWNVSRESRGRLEMYVSLLLTWQKRINLIGPTTVEQIWSRHIVDSLQLLPLLPRKVQVIADLGSGAGLPGLALAIVTGAKAHLYESNGKKAAFLRETIRLTGASAHVHQMRVEDLRNDRDLPKASVVLARAVAPLARLLAYASPFLERGAIGLFHKGQGIDAELTTATNAWKLTYVKHRSITDSKGIILEVKEAIRVRSEPKS